MYARRRTKLGSHCARRTICELPVKYLHTSYFLCYLTVALTTRYENYIVLLLLYASDTNGTYVSH